jgi:hypothetical protein
MSIVQCIYRGRTTLYPAYFCMVYNHDITLPKNALLGETGRMSDLVDFFSSIKA